MFIYYGHIVLQSEKKALGPDNSVRPQAIGQSSDEQETASENDKTDGSTADADSVGDEPIGWYLTAGWQAYMYVYLD